MEKKTHQFCFYFKWEDMLLTVNRREKNRKFQEKILIINSKCLVPPAHRTEPDTSSPNGIKPGGSKLTD